MKLLIIDGNSIINRAFYGIKILTTKKGVFTNGIYGFVRILQRLKEAENPDGIAVAFDLKAPTFRHKMYAGYKAGRHPTPPELLSQIPLLKELLDYMGCHVISLEGFEADDILGTLSFAAEKAGHTAVISTGDRDSLQLISDNTRVLLATTKMGKPEIINMDKAALKEKYGLTPNEMIELKALMGDASDKIPGVRGVGEKTATELIKTFHTIDNLYENLESDVIKPAVKEKLIADRENAYLSKTLGTIVKDAPINTNIEDYLQKPVNKEKLIPMLRELEFYKMLEELGEETEAVKTETAKTEKALSPNGIAFYNINENKTEVSFCAENGYGTVSFEDFINTVKETPKTVILHGAKDIYRTLKSKNYTPSVIGFDTEIAAYLLEPSLSSYEFSRIAEHYVTVKVTAETENEQTAVKGYLLYKKLLDELTEKGEKDLLFNIEMPLTLVLADMESTGFLLDKDGLTNMGNTLSARIAELETEIYSFADETFNINSPKQLGVILFEKLMLPAKKKTKSGYSTNAEVLEDLKDYHPIIPSILEYRTLAKLKATYCEGLLSKMESDNTVHTTFIQTEARTGRISSAEPNLQNIPVRRNEGKKLREFFIARNGNVLLDADYSQIELRVLASMANDTEMIKAFNNGVDIHTLTAGEVFNLPPDMVTPVLRSRAKAVNFGIVYGIGAFSLSKDIGVTRKEADSYIKGYYELYKGIKKYMQNVTETAKEQGFVTTLFGRRRYLPELNSSNGMLRAFGERVARNMPIQGTAADIIKIAMINVYNRLKAEKVNAKLILQVHDELIVESAKEEAPKAAKIMQEEMENAAKLQVKLLAEVGSGENWLKAKG